MTYRAPHSRAQRILATPFLVAAMVGLLVAAAPSNSRAQLRFAVSGLHHLPAAAWEAMSDDAKLAFVEQRADLAVAMGASAIRVGSTSPTIWAFDGLGSSTETGRWLLPDKIIAALAQRDLTLVIVVPDAVGSGLTAYRDYIQALAERYDGDTDFGVAVADNNRDFPDIDDTGAITSADWGAPPAQLTAWADSHTIDVIQIGDEPWTAEQAGTIGGDDYGKQLKQGSAAVKASGDSVKVMMAGTLVDRQNGSDFEARLGTLLSDVVDIADAHVLEATKDPTAEDVRDSLGDFVQWLDDAGLVGVERWVGAFAATADPAGPCGAWPCDDRMQAANLVKGMLAAAASGATHFGYDHPVEVTGALADASRPAGTGLLTIAVDAGADVAAQQIGARPAYATWMRLQTILGDVSADDIEALNQLGPNTVGYRIGDKGWLVWYDWTTAVSPGSGYDGSKRGGSLKGIPDSVAAVAASNLFPVEVGTALGASFTVSADWDSAIYPVNGGEATIELGADVVWIVPSAPASPEPGPEAAAEVVPDQGGSEPTPTDDDGGCSSGHQVPWPSIAAMLALWALTRRRRQHSL